MPLMRWCASNAVVADNGWHRVRHGGVLLGDRERPLLLPRGLHQEVCTPPQNMRDSWSATQSTPTQSHTSKLAMRVRFPSPAPSP